MKESFQALKESFHVLKESFQDVKIPFMICLQCFWDASKWFFGYVCEVFETSPPALHDTTMQRNATIPPPKKNNGSNKSRPCRDAPPARLLPPSRYHGRCLYTPFFIRFIFDQNIFRPKNIPPDHSAPKILRPKNGRGVGAL